LPGNPIAPAAAVAEPARPVPVTRIKVKVSAGAARSAISGWQADCLRVRIHAAPERGKANAALIALLASALGLPKSAIRISAGQHTPRKTLEVTGPGEQAIMRLLQPNPPHP